MSYYTVWVEGTTCRSCEILIEQKWKAIPGVTRVQVNAASGKAKIHVNGIKLQIEQLREALVGTHYHVSETPLGKVTNQRPRWDQLIGIFGIILLGWFVLRELGVAIPAVQIGGTMSFGAVFLIGLIAASSTCIAVVGGLLLSTTAAYNDRYASATRWGRTMPVMLFVVGRIVGYTLLGGLLGMVGSALTPSPVFTATLTIVAALFMIIMGLDMLHLAPSWLKEFMPRMPKRLAHTVASADGKAHRVMPLILGAATFFLPCGFTQALQLYALTTHSFAASALLMCAFALGTAPALIALGYASSSVRGQLGQWFFRFAGALVIVLGIWNIQNGFAIVGHPLSLSFVGSAGGATTASAVTVENGVQVVRMNVDFSGYHPNSFTIKSGTPVRWEVDGTKAGGCASVLVSQSLGIQKLLDPGINTFTFTPSSPGTIAFSCSMGMYRGSFTVVN